jgi:hypothetical protein
MSAYAFLLVAILMLALVIWPTCFLVTALGLLTVGENRHHPWGYFGSFRNLVSLLLYNFLVLTIFCGLWYGGFFISEHWMGIIDIGAPWSWLIGLFVASYVASLSRLRKHPKMILTSLIGPVFTVPIFFLWVVFCAIKFDPFF